MSGSVCRNCGAELGGRYCHACGQDSRDPPNSVPQIVASLFGTAFGLESRGPRSFISLLFRPGRLTRAYVDGQRVRYSHPVQLYLWCTTAFFVTQSFFPMVHLDPDTGGIVSRLSAVTIGTGVSPETLARLAEQGTPLSVFAERFDAAVTAYFPVLLVALVGLVAGLMALQFWRESALTHIVFALHWCAFYFVLEMVRQLLPTLGQWGEPISVGATLLALAYLAVAMRTVYGRGRVATVCRAVVTIVVFASLLAGWLWSTTVIAERLA